MGIPPFSLLGPAVAILIAGLGTPVFAAPSAAGQAPAAKIALQGQEARVKALSGQRHRPAYAEALLTLARLRREAGDKPAALARAREAAAAFDAQVELHKSLSDALPVYDDARAERAAALALGLRRDEAFHLVAELALASGDEATAIRHYVLLVQSQADQPLGRDAYAALQRLGWAAAPLPRGGSPDPAAAPAPPSAQPSAGPGRR